MIIILKKIINSVGLVIISIVIFCSCCVPFYNNTEIDLSDFFGNFKGCAVFYKDNNYYTYKQNIIDERKSPCSTFKIVLTLAGLKYGILKDENTLIKWDGIKRYFDYWNKDLTLKEAFSLSAVWYFEKIANEIGKENLFEFVNEISYGNCDTTDAIPFWLDSTLEISPREQVDFIRNLFEYKFPINKNYIKILKKVMNKGHINGGTLYGKTGTSGESNNSWFVGAYKKNNKYIYFATRLYKGENTTGAEAEKITRYILEDYFLCNTIKLYKKPKVLK